MPSGSKIGNKNIIIIIIIVDANCIPLVYKASKGLNKIKGYW